jgi:hypothetical protein
LLVFLKAPRPGEVKTRLAAELGESLAVSIYRALTELVIRATRPGEAADFRRVLCYAPSDGASEIAAWFRGEALEAQAGKDLGERMHQAFVLSFARGSASAVLIGTDCPTLGRERVAEALLALETADVVVRSAEDGGYTLIGLNRPQPALFADIEWSGDTVLSVTAARARTAGLRLRVLGEDGDIDTVADLRRHFGSLRPHLADDLGTQVGSWLLIHP